MRSRSGRAGLEGVALKQLSQDVVDAPAEGFAGGLLVGSGDGQAPADLAVQAHRHHVQGVHRKIPIDHPTLGHVGQALGVKLQLFLIVTQIGRQLVELRLRTRVRRLPQLAEQQPQRLDGRPLPVDAFVQESRVEAPGFTPRIS